MTPYVLAPLSVSVIAIGGAIWSSFDLAHDPHDVVTGIFIGLFIGLAVCGGVQSLYRKMLQDQDEVLSDLNRLLRGGAPSPAPLSDQNRRRER